MVSDTKYDLTECRYQVLADQSDRLLRVAVDAQGDFGESGILESLHTLDFMLDIVNRRCRYTVIDDFRQDFIGHTLDNG